MQIMIEDMAQLMHFHVPLQMLWLIITSKLKCIGNECFTSGFTKLQNETLIGLIFNALSIVHVTFSF